MHLTTEHKSADTRDIQDPHKALGTKLFAIVHEVLL